MPNSRRFHLPDIPQHVVQRGHGKQLCFLSDADYLEYRRRLASASKRFEVSIHAYVLMTNHVHLLASSHSAHGVPKLMQSVGGGYVRSFNARHGRTGTLWDGRYFSSPVGSDAYFWNCHRYIELNPVRAGIVDVPGSYRWSSNSSNAPGGVDPVRPRGPWRRARPPPRHVLAPEDEDFDGSLRPRSLDEMVGQRRLLAPGPPLRLLPPFASRLSPCWTPPARRSCADSGVIYYRII